MAIEHSTQQTHALVLLKAKGMMRASELIQSGITAATVARMMEKGLLTRLGRGLYQLPDAPIDANHSLAEAAKLVPKGVICLVSALSYHELTDTIPSHVWIAIGPKDRRPRAANLPLQIVRFNPKTLSTGVEEHLIEGVRVRITDPARTVVDLFRYRQSAGRRYKQSPGVSLAIEGLREALRTRKATPSEIARHAREAGIWKIVEPYVEAFTTNA